ncbi:hypothetical protein Ae406Ps2_4723c [Pseudonocardia sp. Ae406_Ps2]|nr:hypothetical protein Ae406Ps2_4723c [Pseudonocardia sp. Ae406_Ps2]
MARQLHRPVGRHSSGSVVEDLGADVSEGMAGAVVGCDHLGRQSGQGAVFQLVKEVEDVDRDDRCDTATTPGDRGGNPGVLRGADHVGEMGANVGGAALDDAVRGIRGDSHVPIVHFARPVRPVDIGARVTDDSSLRALSLAAVTHFSWPAGL